jgi:hypothetical protein
MIAAAERRDRVGRNRGEDTLTRLTLTALPIRCGSPAHAASAAIALGVALAAAPTATLADAQVRGTPEAITIEARNTSVEEVLKALGGAFDVHYRSSANLQARLTGHYEGSLQRVMKRVLDGYSYFVKVGDGRIDVTVLDAPRTAPSPSASDLVRVVSPPPSAAPAQAPTAIAAAPPSPLPLAGAGREGASPPAPSAPSSSYGGANPPPSPPPRAGEGKDGPPAPPSPRIAIVDPPALPAPPAAPSSRRRDDLAIAGGKESRPLPPRRLKIASNSGRWKRGKHHAQRTRLARTVIVCSRPIGSFGWPMMTPVSSYYWSTSEPFHFQSFSHCAPRRYARVK